MATVAAQETRRETPQSKESYLKSFGREWKNIHEGKPPELGLKKEGRPERKAICEDVKLKSREKGLFLVADGVSSANGWYASRETARIMYEWLGENLDRGVENNIQHAPRERKDPLKRVTEYVMGQIVAAIEQADSHMKATGAMNREFHGSATTLSMAKLVELPDTKGGKLQRLFFTNVGDSRIYVQRRGGKLEQVTRDDGMLEYWVKERQLSREDALRIDQAPDPDRLDDHLRKYARQRNKITKSVGVGRPTEKLKVSCVDLKPGDRFVIVSDGVSGQMLTQRIERTIESRQDDDQAEEALQQEALRMSLDGRDPRAKGDDISALVKTIEERGPDRAYLHFEKKQAQTPESLKETLRNIRLRREHVRQEVRQLQQELTQLDSLTPKRERLALMIKLEEAQEQEATYGYYLEKTRLDLVDLQVPPRFHTGEQVNVWREDFDPPGLDRQLWTVVSYDDQSKRYTVRGAGGATRSISRYELENAQSGLLVQLGDELPVVNKLGAIEKGFQVVGFSKDGWVILTKEDDGVRKRVVEKGEDVNESFFAVLSVAEQSRERMEQAAQAYHEAVERQGALRDEVEMDEQIGMLKRAMDAAKNQS